MPVEAKEVFEYLGIKPEDVKDLDTFKTKFDSEFIKQSMINEDSEPVKKILGKTFGTLENEIKKKAKAFGLEVDFDAEDFKKKKVTDKFGFVLESFDAQKKTIIDELTEKAGKGNDEKVKELEEKLNKTKSKVSEYEGLWKKTGEEFEAYKQTAAEKEKSVKLDFYKSEALRNVKFKADINEFEKEGYLSKIEKTYKFDLDENGKAIILDKEGKRIPNPKVSSSFMEIADVLQEEAVKGKLFQLNPDAGKPRQTIPGQQKSPPATNPTTGRRVADRL